MAAKAKKQRPHSPAAPAAPKPSRERIAQAREVARHHFGAAPHKVTPLTGGLTNSVFEFSHEKLAYVIRIAEQPAKLQDYMKEQWVCERAKKEGIPIAPILEVGEKVIGRPYMLQRKIEGDQGDQHPERAAILRELGHYARLIHSIPTEGFGSGFDWSANVLSKNKSWKAFLLDELKAWDRLKVLETHKMLEPRRLTQMRECIARNLKARGAKPMLNHGDLRLKNVIVDKAGKILALIDWENSCSNLAPIWDFSIALHDLTVDEKQCFIEGYGLELKRLKEMSGTMKMLNVLNYAPVVEELVQRKDKKVLELYRLRLNGHLSLYVM